MVLHRLVIGLVCWFAGVALANPVMVQGVRLWTAPDSTRIVIDLSGPTEHQLITLSGPDRVVIDLRDTRIKSGVTAQGAQGVIQGLRTGVRNGHDLRVVLDLASKVKPHSFYLKPDGKNGHRIVVDLRGGIASNIDPKPHNPSPTRTHVASTQAAAVPAPASDHSSPAKSVHASLPKTTAPVATATKKETSNAMEPVAQATVSTSEMKPIKEDMVAAPDAKASETSPSTPVKSAKEAGRGRELIIAIDAGHGGKDVGARGPSGTHEKDVVLAIARKLAALVEKEPGMRPVLVRNGDYFIHLRERMKKARTQRADLFVSIHADAFNDRRARGSSVFVVSERGASSEMARILADQENAADLVGGVSLDDKDELLKSVLLDLSQSASIEASMTVADNVLGELKHIGNVHKSRVQQAGFMVLKSPDVPSILVETAFISNPTEERQLRDAQHQQRLAQAIMKGIRGYFRENPPPGTVMASRESEPDVATSISAQEHVIKRGETLSELAERYSVSMQRLRVANNLTGDRLRVGSVLRIPDTDS